MDEDDAPNGFGLEGGAALLENAASSGEDALGRGARGADRVVAAIGSLGRRRCINATKPRPAKNIISSQQLMLGINRFCEKGGGGANLPRR